MKIGRVNFLLSLCNLSLWYYFPDVCNLRTPWDLRVVVDSVFMITDVALDSSTSDRDLWLTLCWQRGIVFFLCYNIQSPTYLFKVRFFCFFFPRDLEKKQQRIWWWLKTAADCTIFFVPSGSLLYRPNVNLQE